MAIICPRCGKEGFLITTTSKDPHNPKRRIPEIRIVHPTRPNDPKYPRPYVCTITRALLIKLIEHWNATKEAPLIE